MTLLARTMTKATLSNGGYTLAAPFVWSTGHKEAQILSVDVTNANGEIIIVPNAPGILEVSLQGRLVGNEFSGHIDEPGGRTIATGTLVAHDQMRGQFYDDDGTLIGPFILEHS